MMKVKMINKVPLAGKDGQPYFPAPGDVVEVPQSVGEALLRGGDAVKVAEKPVAEPATEEAPTPAKPKRATRKKKSLGAAPENK